MAYLDYEGKQIFYEEIGMGAPCIFLHGNTASSKMFTFLLPLYTEDFHVILMDFLGNGRSQRVTEFPEELWIDQGRQIAALCEHLDCGKVYLVGASGGAYAAINAALERPELFGGVVADSFDGSTLPAGFADGILQERQSAKQDENARGFYEWCQGEDWETVVDLDTQVLVGYGRNQVRLFHRPIESIQVPLLITVSRKDRMLSNDMEAECRRLHRLNAKIQYKIYETGEHPLIVSRREDMAGEIKRFLQSKERWEEVFAPSACQTQWDKAY